MKFELKKAVKTFFGYDATETKNRRNAAPVSSRSEDRELDPARRKLLTANAEDQQRNITLCRWILNKHLDFITKFTIQARTGDPELDKKIESLFAWWSRPNNCDVAGRHSFQKMIRIMESMAFVTGDAGIAKLKTGQIQGIEGTRVRKPSRGNIPANLETKTITHGIIVDAVSKAIGYVINRRTKNGFEYERTIRARDMEWHGYYDRYDQVRGVSPLASAFNLMRDLYESFEYALVKAKYHAFFGIAIKSDTTGEDGFRPDEVRDKDTDGDDDIDDDDAPRYEFDLKPGIKLELNPGDEVDMLESKTPSSEFQDYSIMMIQMALLAADMPLSFFDSRKSSFSAHRSDLSLYIESASSKRANLFEKVRNIAFWKLGQWTRTAGEDGQPLLVLPEGMGLRDLNIKIIPTGQPFSDRMKEANADAKEIAIGINSRQRACAARGVDFWEIKDELAAEETALIDAGVTIEVATPGALTTRDEEVAEGTTEGDDDEQTTED